jgi:hexokinase
MSLQSAVEQIAKEFVVDEQLLKVLTDHFIVSLEAGLQSTPSEHTKGLPMIPTYVTSVPNGRERGVFLAADLGGTNFRVCSVHLGGDSTFSLEQKKSRIPDDLLVAETADELFLYLAKKIQSFVNEFHPDADNTDGRFKLGFTFSYPVDQTALNRGSLIRWTKGFKIQDVVGKDVVLLLQQQLDLLKIPVEVVALANDTVGTLLSHGYSTGASPNGNQGETVIGAIFGTGTNGCYLEPIKEIKKLDPKVAEELLKAGKTHMVINTEWGSFDNELKYLPNTIYDQRIDEISSNPGYHMFEKRISGMFLGEVLRQVLIDLHSKDLIFTQYRDYDKLPHRLRTAFELDSEVLSHIEIDDSSKLKETELSLLQSLRLPTLYEERVAIQTLVRAISRRSAYLSAVPLAGILLRTKALEGYHKEVEIGVDGSVVEFYPGFRSMIRHALALSPLGPDGERKVHILIAKDGSGVGAALCASTVK